MQTPFPTLSLDKELLLDDGNTYTGNDVGQVDAADKFLAVVPGRAYIATIDVTSIDEADTDEAYELHVVESADATAGGATRSHQFAEVVAGVLQMGFVALSPFVFLNIKASGTTPSIVIGKAYVSGVKN